MDQQFDSQDLAYVAELFKIQITEIPITNAAMRCLGAMRKYGGDRWWLSRDLNEVAKRQLKEPVLLVPFSKLQGALEHSLKRPVGASEISYASSQLFEELAALA